MTIEYFFRKCQGTLEHFPNFVDSLDQQIIWRSYGSTIFVNLRNMSRKETSERTRPSANSWKHVCLRLSPSPSPSLSACSMSSGPAITGTICPVEIIPMNECVFAKIQKSFKLILCSVRKSFPVECGQHRLFRRTSTSPPCAVRCRCTNLDVFGTPGTLVETESIFSGCIGVTATPFSPK